MTAVPALARRLQRPRHPLQRAARLAHCSGSTRRFSPSMFPLPLPGTGGGLFGASLSSGVAAPALFPVCLEVARTHAQTKATPHALLEERIRRYWLSGAPKLTHGYLEPPLNLQSMLLYVRCDMEAADEEEEDAEAGASGTGTAIVRPDPLPLAQADLRIFSFVLRDDEDDVEELDADEGGEDAVPINAGRSCPLPHVRMDRLWENLFYPYREKSSVLAYAETALEMARCGVPMEVVNCNRMVLLHGPPGTGKTTLCKAIAQQLSIRLSSLYPQSRFLEINSHSLFSKWSSYNEFSESGKLVQKLFENIKAQLDDDPKLFLCLLIDEVESLAASRSHSSSEPQDAVRAGNAVLTQLDRLRGYPNLLVLCTSNLTEMIDEAFADRVDIKQYVGPPNLEARYEILRSQVEALLQPPAPPSSGPAMLVNDRGVPLPLLSFRQLRRTMTQQPPQPATAGVAGNAATLAARMGVCQQILQIAQQAEGAGGRLLRRAPMHCCSGFRQSMRGRGRQQSLSEFLQQLPAAMRKAQGEETKLPLAPPNANSQMAQQAQRPPWVAAGDGAAAAADASPSMSATPTSASPAAAASLLPDGYAPAAPGLLSPLAPGVSGFAAQTVPAMQRASLAQQSPASTPDVQMQ